MLDKATKTDSRVKPIGWNGHTLKEMPPTSISWVTPPAHAMISPFQKIGISVCTSAV